MHCKDNMGLKPYALRKLYISVVKSTTLYASSVWLGAHRKNNVQRLLNSAQRVHIIMISDSFRSATTEVITVLVGMLPLQYRANELGIMRYCKKGRPSFWPSLAKPTFPLLINSLQQTIIRMNISLSYLV